MGFAPENTLIVAGINEFESSFCAILFRCFSHQLQRELEFALVADQR